MSQINVMSLAKLLASDTFKGRYGRWYHLLDLASQGRPYKVYSLALTHKELCPSVLNTFFKSLKNLVYMVNKGDSVIFALTKEPAKFLGWFKELGFSLRRGSKSGKRGAQLLRPYTYFGIFSNSNFRPKVFHGPRRAKTTDGAIVISARLWEAVKEQSLNRVSSCEDNEALHMFAGTKVFNGRLWFQGKHAKGQVFVSDKLTGCDVLLHGTNIKSELTLGTDAFYIGLDPQPGKLKAYTNRQAMRNFPQMFGIGVGVDPKSTQVYAWLLAELDRKREMVQEGMLEETYEELLEDLIHGRLEESESTFSRLKAAQFHSYGSIRDSAALMRQAILPGIDRMVDPEDFSIRVRIPGATYCQLVSVDVMRMLGKDITVPDGCCVYDSEYMVYVVSNADYVANLRNHGGMDADDKLCQIFRKRGSDIMVWMQRNPSDRGEYSVYKFLGTPPVEVPDLELPALPAQATELDKACPMVELPSKTQPVPPLAGEYGLQDALLDLSLAGSNPGGIINLITLWNASHPRGERNQHMPQMESIVDAMMQTRDPRDIAFILKKAKAMVGHLIYETQLPIDQRLLAKCRGFFQGQFEAVHSKLEREGRLRDSFYTRLVDKLAGMVQVVRKEIEDRILVAWNRQNYLSLLSSPVNQEHIDLVQKRYLKMCAVYGKCPHRTGKKGVITTEGHEWIRQEVQGHLDYLVNYFTEAKYGNPWHKVMVVLAHVGSHTEEKTDHILCRKEMFDTYLKMYAKLQGK